MNQVKQKNTFSALRVRGLEGFLRGCQYDVREGETIYIGRSSACQLHPKVSNGPGAKQWNKVSRKHVKLYFRDPGHIEIEDLSRNGTYLQGKRIHRVVLKKIENDPVILDILGGTIIVEACLIP